MFDIHSQELLILLVIALVVLGPERLPQYAAQFARWVRQVRDFAVSARAQVRAEMGPEFDDVDWQALDPRRYDPRRIVREALLDGEDDPLGLRGLKNDAAYILDESREDGAAGVSQQAPNVPANMRGTQPPVTGAPETKAQPPAADDAAPAPRVVDFDAT